MKGKNNNGRWFNNIFKKSITKQWKLTKRNKIKTVNKKFLKNYDHTKFKTRHRGNTLIEQLKELVNYCNKTRK